MAENVMEDPLLKEEHQAEAEIGKAQLGIPQAEKVKLE